MQQAEHQPVFRIKSRVMKSGNDSVYNNEILTIFNEGHQPKEIKDIKVDTYYKLTYSKVETISKSDTIYIPVTDYFTATNSYYYGQPLYTAIGPDNNLLYSKFYRECISESKNSEYYFASRMHLIKIDYVDIDNTSHAVYFINQSSVDEKVYNSIIDKSKATFPSEPFKVEDIGLDGVKKYIPNYTY